VNTAPQKLCYIKKIKIATARKRFDKLWKNHTLSWDEFVDRLQKNHITSETSHQYANMTKSDRDNTKDVGGFVGGELRHGQRKATNIVSRSLITIDADYASKDFLDIVAAKVKSEYIIYSTHSHTEDNPRYRVVMPLDRYVTPEEYIAISRRIAGDIGIEYFDDTGFQPHRLMYWSSTPMDVEPIFVHENRGGWLSVDNTLATYSDWTDPTLYPISKKANLYIAKEIKKQGHPHEKPGVIGAFNRAYNIHEAISEFLPDVYLPCDGYDNRYTYAGGSTSGGAITYDDMFLYSNHATDPASCKTCSSFDLVRLHKFDLLDDDVDERTHIVNRPSHKAMLEFCSKNDKVKKILINQKIEDAKIDFLGTELTTTTQMDVVDDSWKTDLTINPKTKAAEVTIKNAIIILMKDPNIQGIYYDMFSKRIRTSKPLPWITREQQCGEDDWRDMDDAQLECYILSHYAKFPQRTILTAFAKVTDDRRHHPIRDYFSKLPEWDGIPRVESFFIDYLGVDDNSINREMTRKTLVAAVARIHEPGIKFDNMLVLKGEQGIGKSRILKRIAKEWFNDSMRLTDTRDKTASELIQGSWIIEVGELAGFSRVDERVLKSFLSRQEDVFRAAYGRRVNSHKRQCIFIGTTNDDQFLTDTTGNRRFWTMSCNANRATKKIEDITDDIVNQLWSEAIQLYKKGEKLYLSPNHDRQLRLVQTEFNVRDEHLEGYIAKFLDIEVPEDWDSRELNERLEFYRGDIDTDKYKLVKREYISIVEIWCELMKEPIQRLSKKEKSSILKVIQQLPDWDNTASVVKRTKPYGAQRVYRRVIDL